MTSNRARNGASRLSNKSGSAHSEWPGITIYVNTMYPQASFGGIFDMLKLYECTFSSIVSSKDLTTNN
ncbi:hypothetical protein N7495_000011 [Penicillium taxi]|uniref:uncharacterized protein n=1 Tax=Penicillium taxi TaxID=168475 RepID=UPI002545658F|nr:uncharacterized protein N7495_000011 [Penicillium taxi]KAJ5907329.1 hypothetical protein N7495_000011 [Penicillium taxi]